jgi:uncharacterized protein YkwD
VTGTIMCAAVGASPAPVHARAAAACANASIVSVDVWSADHARRSVLCLLNAERAAHDLPALRWSRLLGRSAARHARDMRAHRYFAHVSRRGGRLRQRVCRTGYRPRRRPYALGETLAWGAGTAATPDALVDALMASPGHRAIVLDRRFRDLGAGLALGAPLPGIPGRAATLALNFGRR